MVAMSWEEKGRGKLCEVSGRDDSEKELKKTDEAHVRIEGPIHQDGLKQSCLCIRQ